MTRLLVLAGLIALTVAAPTASAATAPARVAFSVVSKAPHYGGGGGAYGGVALPGGSVVAFSYDSPTQTSLVLKLQRNGALDPAFGNAGIVRLTTPGQVLTVERAERVAGGKLLIAGTQRALAGSAPAQIVLLRLLASGALDPSFGAGGFVATSITSSTGALGLSGPGPRGAASTALASDGSIVVTGTRLSPTETNPLYPATTDWVVVKLGPDGEADAGFGVATIAVGSGRRAAGTSIVVTPQGTIVVLGFATQAPGSSRASTVLAGLTADGAPDPAFNGGVPVIVPFDGPDRLQRHASGALDLIGTGAIVRFGAGGILDTSFAAGGRLAFGEGEFVGSYVAAPDGGALILGMRAASGPPAPGRPPVDLDRRITLSRLTAGGTIAGSTSLYTPFGGGEAAPYFRRALPAVQNSFSGELLRRDDGSYLLLGGLGIHVSTGKMDTLWAPFVAAQAFTPTFAPDATFGGPQQPASFKVQIRRRRAVTSGAQRFVALRVTSSQAGLVSIRVRDSANRLLASGTHPVYAAGTEIMSVRVTTDGRRVLSRARKGLRIAVRHEFRDILAATATGLTKGRLR